MSASPLHTARLDEIADLNPKLADTLESDAPVSFVPMAAVTAETASTTTGEERRFSEVRKGYTPFLDGDVLVAKITPCFENGKIAQATLTHKIGFGSTEFHVVRPRAGKAEARYLLHFLRQERIRRDGELKMTGSAGQRRVPEHFLASLEVPDPPLQEQRRIVELLDKAETLRVKRRAAFAELDTLTEAIFLDLFGDLATNSKRWPKGSLGEVAVFVGGGTPSRARPEFFGGSTCWATSKDMKDEYLDDTEEHITQEAIEQSATNLVPAGTILIVVKSKILAHSLPVAIARVPTCFGQDLKGIKVSEVCEVAFVASALRFGRRWLMGRARGINTEGLTLEHLKAFPLFLPPLSLQRDFARRIAAVEKLRAAQRTSLAELDALFAALQHRAFQGEL